MSIANHVKVYILFAFFFFFWRILFTFFSFSFYLLHISSYWNFCISSLILRCWRLFMVKLWNHGLLDASTMNNCSIILESNQNGGSDSGTNWRPSVSSTTIYIQSSLPCICNKLYNIEQCMLLKYWGWGLSFKLCFELLSELCLSYKTEQKNYNYKNVYSTEG